MMRQGHPLKAPRANFLQVQAGQKCCLYYTTPRRIGERDVVDYTFSRTAVSNISMHTTAATVVVRYIVYMWVYISRVCVLRRDLAG